MENVKGKERKLFADQNGHLFEVLKFGEGEVHLSPQGGGFITRVPEEAFGRKFRPASLPAWHAMEVEAEWLPDSRRLPAFSDGRRWNGWAVPYFDLDTGLKLCELMPNLAYSRERDAFIWRDPDAPDDEDVIFETRSIVVDDTPYKVYGIGAAYWTWDFVD